MSQTDPKVRRVAFKIVEKWEFDDEGHEYDWEVLAEGKRYLHRKDESLRKGWIRRKQLKTIEIDKPELLSWLKNATDQMLAEYPNGYLTRKISGVIKLRYRGHIWKRGDFDNYGTPCAGNRWSRLVIGDGKEEWRQEPKESWEILNQKVAQLEATTPDDGPRRSVDTPGPQEPIKQKRTKYGIKIFSSDGKHYFQFGCWRSTKYPGRFSIRLGVAGRRTLYTIRRADLDAILAELQRLLPVQTAVPQMVPPQAEAPQNLLPQARIS